jgi:hypothetical protein
MFKVYLNLNNSKILKTICDIPGCLSTANKVYYEKKFFKSLKKNIIILKSKNIKFHGNNVIVTAKKKKQIVVCERHQKQIFKK